VVLHRSSTLVRTLEHASDFREMLFVDNSCNKNVVISRVYFRNATVYVYVYV